MYLSEEEQEKEQEKQDEKTTDPNEFNNWIIDEEIDLDEELFKKHFNFQKPSDMLMLLNKKDKTKNNELVKMIISGLKDLKEEIKKMSEEENKIEDPEWIVWIVEKILKFNEQNQQGKGLKILTPNQMLSRLPIILAQLKAGNNSEKLKNENKTIIVFSLWFKNMTKQVYNNLINYIWIR